MIVALALAAAATAKPTPPAPTPEMLAAERAFRACPGSELIGKTAAARWTPLSSATRRHREIRARQGLDFPEDGDRILFHSMGSHDVERSVVAVRRPDGVWHVDAAGERTYLTAIPLTKSLPHLVYDLSPEDSRRVDAILDDPCLEAAPVMLLGTKPMGAMERLEFDTSAHQGVRGMFGVRTPAEDALIKLIVRE